MIQCGEDSFDEIGQNREIDHIMILAQRPVDLGADSVVVAVQSLAQIAAEGDEMSGAEHQIGPDDANVVVFHARNYIQTSADGPLRLLCLLRLLRYGRASRPMDLAYANARLGPVAPAHGDRERHPR